MSGWRVGRGALLPPIGVGLVVWYLVRAVFNADRAERAVVA